MDWTPIIGLLTALGAYAWPLVALIGMLLFRAELRALSARVRKGEFLGQKIELDPAAEELRNQAAKEALGPTPEDDAVDRVEVLKSTAAVLEARTDDERNARLQELRRTVVSPLQRLKLATEWVLERERAHGRDPIPLERGPADLQSGRRLIDIKVVRSRAAPYIRYSRADFDRIEVLPNFYIYFVVADEDDPSSWTLKVVDQPTLMSALEAGTYFYEIPSRALLATAPGLEALAEQT